MKDYTEEYLKDMTEEASKSLNEPEKLSSIINSVYNMGQSDKGREGLELYNRTRDYLYEETKEAYEEEKNKTKQDIAPDKLDERMLEDIKDGLQDRLMELADSSTPVYNYELLKMFLEYPDVIGEYEDDIGAEWGKDDSIYRKLLASFCYKLEREAGDYLAELVGEDIKKLDNDESN